MNEYQRMSKNQYEPDLQQAAHLTALVTVYKKNGVIKCGKATQKRFRMHPKK